MSEKNVGWSAAKYSKLVGFEGDWRDTWWRQDYLELIAHRLGMRSSQRLLDVGCGAGHWGQRLATLLEDRATGVGVDHEAGFLAAAQSRADERLGAGRFSYLEASAEALPFEDGSFDLVTCQTVLIHLPDVRKALGEMLRVLAPGGLLLVAEPNNRVNALVNRVGVPAPPFRETLELLSFEDTCLRGKIATGQGDSAIGERVPALFSELGLRAIEASTNEACPTFVPPYESVAARGYIEMLRTTHEAQCSRWGDEESARRYFLAGGGAPESFDEVWAMELASQARLLADVDAGRRIWGGGFLMYLVSGRKPA